MKTSMKTKFKKSDAQTNINISNLSYDIKEHYSIKTFTKAKIKK